MPTCNAYLECPIHWNTRFLSPTDESVEPQFGTTCYTSAHISKATDWEKQKSRLEKASTRGGSNDWPGASSRVGRTQDPTSTGY